MDSQKKEAKSSTDSRKINSLDSLVLNANSRRDSQENEAMHADLRRVIAQGDQDDRKHVSQSAPAETNTSQDGQPKENDSADSRMDSDKQAVGGIAPASLRKTHELLAHINKETVKKFLVLNGTKFTDDLDQCEDCIKAKQTRAVYHSRPAVAKATEIGTVHADLCSPSTESIGKSKHFLMITDEFSKYRKVYFLKTKDEAINCI